MLPIKTILHPTDFSQRSDYAFKVACTLASDYGANLVIMHVMSAPVFFGDGVVVPGMTDLADELREKLKDLEVPDERVDVVRRLADGNPAAEILQVAQLSNADLIVMGTHGRSGLSRLLMGSVAEEVMRRATCPVLTVTTPKSDALKTPSLEPPHAVRLEGSMLPE